MRIELEVAVLDALEAEAEERQTTAPQLIAMLLRDRVKGAA